MKNKNTAIHHYFERFEPRTELPSLSVFVFKTMLTLSLWFTIARTRRQLGQLTDDELRDIGIDAADAKRESQRKFYDI